MSSLDQEFGRRWVTSMLTTFDSEASQLGELDRQAGDGDFGDNLSAAFRRVRQAVEKDSPDTFTEWLTTVSKGFLGTGGTSGPLFGMFFREISRSTSNPEPTMAELSQGLADGLATVQRYGKADVGHKTMVDAIAPAAEAMALSVASDDGSELTRAATAAIEGALSTASITASRGRAAYVGEVSLGVLDPGAVAVALILQSAENAAAGSSDPADSSWIARS